MFKHFYTNYPVEMLQHQIKDWIGLGHLSDYHTLGAGSFLLRVCNQFIDQYSSNVLGIWRFTTLLSYLYFLVLSHAQNGTTGNQHAQNTMILQHWHTVSAVFGPGLREAVATPMNKSMLTTIPKAVCKGERHYMQRHI